MFIKLSYYVEPKNGKFYLNITKILAIHRYDTGSMIEASGQQLYCTESPDQILSKISPLQGSPESKLF